MAQPASLARWATPRWGPMRGAQVGAEAGAGAVVAVVALADVGPRARMVGVAAPLQDCFRNSAGLPLRRRAREGLVCEC